MFKHIAQGPFGYDHTPYFNDYLVRVRSSMLPSFHAFVANVDHHTLNHPNSLHDTWMVGLNISEGTTGPERSPRSVTGRLELLGQLHDRHIILTYGGMERYHFEAPSLDSRYGHHDLLYHEGRIANDGCLEHEMEFMNGRRLLVAFRTFSHQVELLRRADDEEDSGPVPPKGGTQQ